MENFKDLDIKFKVSTSGEENFGKITSQLRKIERQCKFTLNQLSKMRKEINSLSTTATFGDFKKTVNDLVKVKDIYDKIVNSVEPLKTTTEALSTTNIKLAKSTNKVAQAYVKFDDAKDKIDRVIEREKELAQKLNAMRNADGSFSARYNKKDYDKLQKELSKEQALLKHYSKLYNVSKLKVDYAKLEKQSTVNKIIEDEAKQSKKKDFPKWSDISKGLEDVRLDKIVKVPLSETEEEIQTFYTGIQDGIRKTYNVVDGEVRKITTSIERIGSPLKSEKKPILWEDKLKQLKDVRLDKVIETPLIGGEKQIKEYYTGIEDGVRKTYIVVNNEVKKITKSLAEIGSPLKSEKTFKDNKLIKGLQRFQKSLGKIVFYRLVRRGMADIYKAAISSVQQLAEFNTQFNKTMSIITTSNDKLKASLGLFLQPLLETVAPGLEHISNIIVEIANEFSYLDAKMKGLSDYTVINAKYMKDYKESLAEANKQLLTFDKFNALQKGSSLSNIYQRENLSTRDNAKQISPVVQTLYDLIGLFKSSTEVLKSIYAFLRGTKFVDIMMDVSHVLINVIGTSLTKITKLIQKLTEIFKPLGERISDLLGSSQAKIMFEEFKNTIKEQVNGIGDIFKNFGKGISSFFGNIFGGVRGFATGGIVARENIIRTNENGTPEWLGKMGDRGAIVNDTQMSSVMYSAVYKAVSDSLARTKTSDGSNITINFEGINSNSLARVLAQPIAQQFTKQNIKVKGV